MTKSRARTLALLVAASLFGLLPAARQAYPADPVIIPNLPDATGVIQSNSLPCWQAGQAVNSRTRECTIAQILNTLEAAQVTAALGYAPVNRGGDTMTGALTLSGAPSASLHATSKAYVDGLVALRLALAGGTMTGALTLSGAPSGGLHATSKAYVDAAVAGVTAAPGGSSGQLQYNNAGALAGMTAMSGDCTLNTGTGAIVCTKTNGTNFATVATTGSAADLSTGTAAIGRIPTGTTTSSSTVPLNNDGRLNSTVMYLPIGSPATATTTAAPASDFLFSGPLTWSIAASTAPLAKCGANPAATLSIILKKNGTMLCTVSLSTACAVSGCSIGATSFVAGDNITAESGADASATGVGVSIPLTKAN